MLSASDPLTGGTAVLCILAAPVLSMRLGHVDAGADPASYTGKQAYDEIASAFGPGANGAFTVVVDLGQAASPRQALEGSLGQALAAVPDVASVAPVQASPDGAVLYTTVIPLSRPQDAATGTLQDTLRDQALPRALAGTRATGYVTGLTSAQLDFRDQVASQLPVIIGVVIAAAFLILLAALRSPVLALKAAILNLLSIGAAYGVVVAVFQWGWGSSLLGVSEKVPVESYVPMMMFAIVFGLSMDYEVFLLSRIREAWLASRDNHASVAAGLAATARVISCAALIMASVFLSFLLSTSVVVKMLALGLGVSVLIDASVIRLVVVPASMFLIGRLNWWMPGWLDRIMPRLEA
ncbi:MAG TPA: MMPL family transporter [Streptosporangiaceae bacterium]|nr:MMPL family transporter [Streptosporangiaceae bacterium]